MRLFDSHAHIGAPELIDDASPMLERARAAGVVGVIAVGAGYGVAANQGAVELAASHPDVWATAGVHPHDASEWGGDAVSAVEGWLGRERVQAVGECGLDYWYEHSPRDAQRECLRAQIRLARSRRLPLVIHIRPRASSRDAFEELLQIFDDEGAERVGGVIHCFTGDRAFADECLARSFAISFSGILTFKKSSDLRVVAKGLPLDRLLVETDAPLLAPVPHRGRRNEPAYVRQVAECLAALHDTTPEAVADRTAERCIETFRLQVRN